MLPYRKFLELLENARNNVHMQALRGINDSRHPEGRNAIERRANQVVGQVCLDDAKSSAKVLDELSERIDRIKRT